MNSVRMERATQLLNLAVLLLCLLVLGCQGAPSRNVEARSILADPHIVNGNDANIEDIPYQISLEILLMHGCGGVIVSENYALTAAHCLDTSITGPTMLKRIRAGSTTEFPLSWGGSIHQIAEVKHHSMWSMSTIDYDVGVIRVSNSFVYGERVQAIVMPPAGESFLDFSRNATVSGWGLTRPGGWLPAWHLQSVEIPLVTRERCIELHQGAPGNVPSITTRMLCAAGTGRGGPCQGDSGGPMVHRGKVVGLVSWGVRCNDPTFPTVFTNILNEEIRGFIRDNTGL